MSRNLLVLKSITCYYYTYLYISLLHAFTTLDDDMKVYIFLINMPISVEVVRCIMVSYR